MVEKLVLAIWVIILILLACSCANLSEFDPPGDIPVINVSVPFPATFPI